MRSLRHTSASSAVKCDMMSLSFEIRGASLTGAGCGRRSERVGAGSECNALSRSGSSLVWLNE